MERSLDRARLLLAQHRHKMAERELRGRLAEEPEDAEAHALIALCLAQNPESTENPERLREASEFAERGVGLAPDEPLGHYALAATLLRRKRPQQAEQAVLEAIRLDPYDADYFALLAAARLASSEWPGALEAADQGLACDPDNIDCRNGRSIALERLGRSDEAIDSAGQTLRVDPEDPDSHAAFGLTLLNGGRYEAARDAFREALRLDPSNETARWGMMQALSARSLLFRVMYQFFVRLSRLSGGAQMALIFGAYVGMQLLTRLAATTPFLQPLVLPILMVYLGFAVMTWITAPLFNTFLRFHPFGRHLLNQREQWESNFIATCLAMVPIGFVLGIFLAGLLPAFACSFYWLLLTTIVVTVFRAEPGSRKRMAVTAGLIIALLPVAGVISAVIQQTAEPMATTMRFFSFGVLGIQIAANYFAVRPERY